MHNVKYVKKHVLSDDDSHFIKDESCTVLVRRNSYLKKRKGLVALQDLPALIDELEQQSNKEGHSFAIKKSMRIKSWWKLNRHLKVVCTTDT